MEERRRINRVEFHADSVIVVCETLQKIYGKAKNISPLGVAVTVKDDGTSLVGKDIILVADTTTAFSTRPVFSADV